MQFRKSNVDLVLNHKIKYWLEAHNSYLLRCCAITFSNLLNVKMLLVNWVEPTAIAPDLYIELAAIAAQLQTQDGDMLVYVCHAQKGSIMRWHSTELIELAKAWDVFPLE